MFCTKWLIFLYYLHVCYCDWVAEWMSPVQDQLRQKAASRRLIDDDDVLKMVEVSQDIPDSNSMLGADAAQLAAESAAQVVAQEAAEPTTQSPPTSTTSLKIKLEETITNAEALINKLLGQIAIVNRKEQIIKDAIANGRSGVTTVTVNTLNNQPAKTYIVRDGSWVLCNGMVQYPTGTSAGTNLFSDLFAAPRCIGQEVVSKQDQCVFNSIAKYEVVPEIRKLDYIEDNFLCLRSTFNRTLEQYRSVPRHIVNTTCKDGEVRSLLDNIQECGLRVLSEYTYYPHRSSAASLLPLEYCTEKDGPCKLVVAWHLTAALVENFEFFESEDVFNKMFMKPPTIGPYIEHII